MKRIKRLKKIFFSVVWLFVVIFSVISCTDDRTENIEVSESYVSFAKSDSDFELFSGKDVCSILVSPDDFSGVLKVAEYLQDDIKKVTGKSPRLIKDEIPSVDQVIIIGTIGKSSLVDRLVQDHKIDIGDLQGKWESSFTEVVEKPFPGVGKALVIAGSDKRGTIYGMFELSKNIGVSPWYWWADVPVKTHSQLSVKEGRYVLGEPKVKYRGLFLNDEEPALGRWAVKNYGGFTHEFYERVFELILRLKGNYLWPAMWWASFNSDDPQNPVLADEMGIVMGTTHHEPMVRAHAEWKPWGGKDWNYSTNSGQLQKFWREGIERMNNRETVVTVGMRGDGDIGMSEETNVSLLQRIIKDQRGIIEEVTGKPADETPQLWALYKEVQEYYDKGMRVPEDITLLLCDDNWGNVRKLPDPEDAMRKGGYGMYYHFDFVGGPRNYKWLNVSPLPRIWEQMHLTYQHGVDRIWLVNVGDLKPMELPISFFLDYAWNPDAIPVEKLDSYTKQWAAQQFGRKYNDEIAEILDLYTKYNGRRTPELLFSDTYSLENYREFEKVVNEYKTLEERAKKIYEQTEDDQKDAFYQLVYHPVLACSNLYELYYAHALNRLYASQGRAATNDMAERVKELFNKDEEITEYYHHDLSDGKWDMMMSQTHIGYTYWQQPPRNVMPDVKFIDIPENAKMRVSVEGTSEFWPGTKQNAELPSFDSFNDQSFYIEIFNTGKATFSYELNPQANWIVLPEKRKTVSKQERIEVSVDWSKLELGKYSSNLEIRSDEDTVSVNIIAQKYNHDAAIKGFVERNGVVSMEAPHFTEQRNGKDISWFVIPGLSRTGSGITTEPVTQSVTKIGDETPMLEYDFYLLKTPDRDSVEVDVHLAPTLNFKNGKGLKFAVSIDDEEPRVINLHEGTEEPDWTYPLWFNEAVSNKVMVKKSSHQVLDSGKHTLKLWMIDNGVVFQKIIINNGGLKPSYLGPPESSKL